MSAVLYGPTMMDFVKYPRTPHLVGSRLQPGDEDLEQVAVSQIAGESLVWEEKIDGANAAFSFAGGRLQLQSRGHVLRGGAREGQFNIFKAWVETHQAAFRAAIGERYIVYGEWCYAKHTVFYDTLPHFFLEFDVFDRERGLFLSTPARRALLADLPIASVPVVHEGGVKTEAAMRNLIGRSRFKSEAWREHLVEEARVTGQPPERVKAGTDGSDLAEGLYLKGEEGHRVVGRYKFVRTSCRRSLLPAATGRTGRSCRTGSPRASICSRGRLHERAPSKRGVLLGGAGQCTGDRLERRRRAAPLCGRHEDLHSGSNLSRRRRCLDAHVHGDACALRTACSYRTGALAGAVPRSTVARHSEARHPLRGDRQGSLASASPRPCAARRHDGMGVPVRQGVARTLREQVFHLVRWHQRPFHMLFAKGLGASIIRYSVVGAWSELIALAHADNLGRIAPNTGETETDLALLQAEVEERRCWGAAWPFASDAARVWFCRAVGRSPHYDPPPPKGSEVVVLSGLPGAGKDTYCRTHFHGLPQVSLDAWRERLDIEPDETQGRVIQAALEEARQYLRAKRTFVWNATNVSRLNRDRATGLCLDYDARVEIHALDPPPERLFAQNRRRGAVVPANVLDRLIAKWEPPSLTEAHVVKWVD